MDYESEHAYDEIPAPHEYPHYPPHQSDFLYGDYPRSHQDGYVRKHHFEDHDDHTHDEYRCPHDGFPGLPRDHNPPSHDYGYYYHEGQPGEELKRIGVGSMGRTA